MVRASSMSRPSRRVLDAGARSASPRRAGRARGGGTVDAAAVARASVAEDGVHVFGEVGVDDVSPAQEGFQERAAIGLVSGLTAAELVLEARDRDLIAHPRTQRLGD